MIGQNPGRPAKGDLPKTSSLHRLNDWMRRAGVRHYSFVNVSQEPGKFRRSPEDTDFFTRCVLRAESRACWRGERLVIVAMGTRASRALGKDTPHVRWPHPSGLNRQINDPRNITRAVNRLKRALA